MTEIGQCEFCDRPIKADTIIKTLSGKEHVFCTEFCFRLYFYDVPKISYDDLKKMYELRCVTVKAPDFRSLIVKDTEK